LIRTIGAVAQVERFTSSGDLGAAPHASTPATADLRWLANCTFWQANTFATRRLPQVIDMSVYRTLHRGVPSDVNVSDIGRQPSATSTSTDAVCVAPARAEVHYVRKALPASQPFPATFEWIASLPPEVRPFQLLKQFPRIANMLAQAWPDPAAFREYMFDLLIDRRGGRQGFPQAVRSELLQLRTYFDDIHPLTPTVARHDE